MVTIYWCSVVIGCIRGGGALPFLFIPRMCGQNGWIFETQKAADGCKFLPTNLRMGHDSYT